MKVTVLGSVGDIGGSGVLINSNKTNILLDYGVKIGGSYPQLPIKEEETINAVIMTHAHQDHVAGIPELCKKRRTEIYATPPTIDFVEFRLNTKNSMDNFDVSDIRRMKHMTKRINFKQSITKNDITFELRESGHMVGSSMVLVESNGKKLLYTSDIKLSGSKIVRAADLDVGDIDLLIIESTYSQNETQTSKQPKDLVDFANKIIDKKGVLLIPASASERAQNIACELYDANFKHKILMDGYMTIKSNEIIARHPKYIRDPDLFTRAVVNLPKIEGNEKRSELVKKECVVIFGGAMGKGKTAEYYLDKFGTDKTCGIASVSHRGNGTPMKQIFDTRKMCIEKRNIDISAELESFNFSAHADREELFDVISKIGGNPKVLTVHGDKHKCERFAQDIHERFGLDAQAAVQGQSITV